LNCGNDKNKNNNQKIKKHKMNRENRYCASGCAPGPRGEAAHKRQFKHTIKGTTERKICNGFVHCDNPTNDCDFYRKNKSFLNK